MQKFECGNALLFLPVIAHLLTSLLLPPPLLVADLDGADAEDDGDDEEEDAANEAWSAIHQLLSIIL
jgi:hypothetical protein